MIDKWNHHLKHAIQTIDSLAKITEQLKDELLAVEHLPDKDIYWKKVINPELEKIVINYESAIKQIAKSTTTFNQTCQLKSISQLMIYRKNLTITGR